MWTRKGNNAIIRNEGGVDIKFNINVSLNIDKNHSLKMGNRTARIRHERREHGFTNNPSIDPNLSKYNNINGLGFNDYYNYKNAMEKTLEPYIKHHNNLKSVKKNPNRKITDLHKFLMQRGKRIPYKFLVIKLGTGETNKKLLNLFKSKGFSAKDYYQAFDQTVHDYGLAFNKANGKHLSFDHLDANVDETRRYGAPHAHGGVLANATTKSGKTSLSFDRATRQNYGGTSNISAWSLMQNKEDHRFLKVASKDFQRYLGPDFQFSLQRNPHSSAGMSHSDFIKTKTKQDDYTRQSKLNERKSRQSLLRNNHALSEQNTKLVNQNKQLRNLVKSLREKDSIRSYNNLVDKSNEAVTQLTKKNESLQSQLQQAKACNSSLYRRLLKSEKYNLSLQKHIQKLDWNQWLFDKIISTLPDALSTLKTNQAELDRIENLAYSKISNGKSKELPDYLKKLVNQYANAITKK